MLGLAGSPHCAAMCGAACAVATRDGGPGSRSAFHAARLFGYAAAGAVAASSVGAIAAFSQWTPALRPLWTLVHLAALGLGLFLLWQGRQPAWLANLGLGRQRSQAPPGGWQRISGPMKAASAGGLWVAWPCGLLQSALVVAALANSAPAGAAVMAGFAATSATGLLAAPWLLVRLGGAGAAAQAGYWATRAAGALLATASAWALGHGLWERVLAYCGF